jgi:uncharacterized membrane protein HdeD (DUF308 family)
VSTLQPSASLAVSIPWLHTVQRGQTIVIAIIGALLGLIGLIFPEATLLTIAIIFGSYLVASGLFRILSAVIADNYQPPMRWMSAVMGLFIVVTGVLVLANPFDSYVVLAIFIGVGWIIEGLIDLVAGIRGAIHPRWFGYLSGIISIAAGVVMFVLPATSIPLLVQIGSIFLIIVSLTTLLTLPRRSRTV